MIGHVADWMRNAWRTVTDADFPYRSGHDPMPVAVQGMFWSSVLVVFVAAITFAVTIPGGSIGLSVLGQHVDRDTLLWPGGSGGVLALAAAVGLLIAYGVWSERGYPRNLAVASLVGCIGWAVASVFKTHDLSAETIVGVIAAVGAIRSMIFSADMRGYYPRHVHTSEYDAPRLERP